MPTIVNIKLRHDSIEMVPHGEGCLPRDVPAEYEDVDLDQLTPAPERSSRVGRLDSSSSSVSMYSGQLVKCSAWSMAEKSRPARSPGCTYAAGTPQPVSVTPAAPTPKALSRDRRDMGWFGIARTCAGCRSAGSVDNGPFVQRHALHPHTLSMPRQKRGTETAPGRSPGPSPHARKVSRRETS